MSRTKERAPGRGRANSFLATTIQPQRGGRTSEPARSTAGDGAGAAAGGRRALMFLRARACRSCDRAGRPTSASRLEGASIDLAERRDERGAARRAAAPASPTRRSSRGARRRPWLLGEDRPPTVPTGQWRVEATPVDGSARSTASTLGDAERPQERGRDRAASAASILERHGDRGRGAAEAAGQLGQRALADEPAGGEDADPVAAAGPGRAGGWRGGRCAARGRAGGAGRGSRPPRSGRSPVVGSSRIRIAGSLTGHRRCRGAGACHASMAGLAVVGASVSPTWSSDLVDRALRLGFRAGR